MAAWFVILFAPALLLDGGLAARIPVTCPAVHPSYHITLALPLLVSGVLASGSSRISSLTIPSSVATIQARTVV